MGSGLREMGVVYIRPVTRNPQHEFLPPSGKSLNVSSLLEGNCVLSPEGRFGNFHGRAIGGKDGVDLAVGYG